jgi:hypothetical protein
MSGIPSSSRITAPLSGSVTAAAASSLAMVSSNSRGAAGPSAITVSSVPSVRR